jgi:hypothetical protein
MLQEARKGFTHINQIAWLSWGSLLLPHVPVTLGIDDKLQALAIRIQEAEDSFTDGLITQEEYNIVTVDMEAKRGVLERELQVVGVVHWRRIGKGNWRSENAQSESDNAGAAGSLDDNHPMLRLKWKADDALEDIRGSDNAVGNTGTTTMAGPPIPMMTVPRQKKEKGSSKQVASSSGVDDDKEPEGPVS